MEAEQQAGARGQEYSPSGPTTTLGYSRVRLGFNPSNNPLVDKIKTNTGNLIDLCETLKKPGEVGRLAALAQTAYEEAAMWAVKAATAD